MSKVAILENTSILRLRLERILTKQGFPKIEFISDNMVNLKTTDFVLKDAVLIIIDLDHHELNPIELIHMIRQTKNNFETPIIGLSQSSGISTLKTAIAAGCSDFILKPFTDEALTVKVHNLLKVTGKATPSFAQQIAPDQSTEEGNPNFIWSKDFEIGIPEIDADHNMIIKRFETLYLLMKEGKGHEYYQELLYFLNDYVHRHFEKEEKFQLEISYDQYNEHKAIHDEFKARVAKIIDGHKSKAATNFDLIQINLFIKDWLIHHILIEDFKMGKFYSSKVHKD